MALHHYYTINCNYHTATISTYAPKATELLLMPHDDYKLDT